MSYPVLHAGRAAQRDQEPPRKTILVADDEESLLRVLALVLEQEGYRVVTACNGRAALAAYYSNGADVVITDFMMPEMSGADLVRALRQSRPHVPVVVMSSLEESTVCGKCSGHAHFFRKPFNMAEFLRTIATLAGDNGSHVRLAS